MIDSLWLWHESGDRLKLHILRSYVYYFISHGNVYEISVSITCHFLLFFYKWRELYHTDCFHFPAVYTFACLLGHQGQKIRTKERRRKKERKKERKNKTDYDDDLGYQDGHVLVI